VLLLDVLIAPRTEIKVDLWAWPLVSVPLIVARMEVQITVQAALGDALRYFAVAQRANDCRIRLNGLFDGSRFPTVVDQRYVGVRLGAIAPRV